jgi:enoyl-CoA hydratase
MQLNTDKMVAEKEGHIGWITFNNPAKRNAVSLEMWQALGVILTSFQQDEEVRVVILKGAGGKSFVSGADISEFETKRNSAAASEAYAKQSANAHTRLYKLDKPLIAMIQGYCIGGGLAVALNADVRFATPDSKFGIPAAKLGLGYGFGAVKTLADLVGPSSAKDILFSARFLDAEEALQIGLINRIVSREELEATVRDYANTIGNNAPLTIKAVKASVRELLKDPEKRDLEKINQLTRQCFDSKDYAEGRRAFMEKRRPVFTGE